LRSFVSPFGAVVPVTLFCFVRYSCSRGAVCFTFLFDVCSTRFIVDRCSSFTLRCSFVCYSVSLFYLPFTLPTAAHFARYVPDDYHRCVALFPFASARLHGTPRCCTLTFVLPVLLLFWFRAFLRLRCCWIDLERSRSRWFVYVPVVDSVVTLRYVLPLFWFVTYDWTLFVVGLVLFVPDPIVERSLRSPPRFVRCYVVLVTVFVVALRSATVVVYWVFCCSFVRSCSYDFVMVVRSCV